MGERDKYLVGANWYVRERERERERERIKTSSKLPIFVLNWSSWTKFLWFLQIQLFDLISFGFVMFLFYLFYFYVFSEPQVGKVSVVICPKKNIPQCLNNELEYLNHV